MSMTHYFNAPLVTPSGQINQITEQNVDPSTQEYIDSFDGQVDPSYAAVMLQKPTITITSSALALLLGYVSLGGMNYTSTGSSVDTYWQPAAPGSTRDPTACVKLSSAQGMLCIESIEAQENQPATATVMAYPISADGVAPPLAITTGVTMPASLATRAVYTTGPVNINGTLIGGVKSTSIRMGIEITHDPDSGGAYPILTYIRARKPMITVRTTNVDLVSSLGLFVPQNATSGSTKVYFRKLAPGGTRVINATANHISLSPSAGMILARRVGGSNGQPAMAEIDIAPTFDGTNAILAVNTATAIT